MNKKNILIIAGLFLNQYTIADTKLTILSDQGTAIMWANDKYIRIEMKKNEQTMKQSGSDPMENGSLFRDIKAKKNYVIMDDKKALVDMSMSDLSTMRSLMAPGLETEKTQKITPSYSNKRGGSVIAGLKTVKYDLLANGKKCYEVLLTKDNAYSSVMKNYDEKLLSDPDDDICIEVDKFITSELSDKYGYAVKITDNQGKVEMLLTDFKTNVSAPTKYLAYPAGYKIMTMMEMMGGAIMDAFTPK